MWYASWLATVRTLAGDWEHMSGTSAWNTVLSAAAVGVAYGDRRSVSVSVLLLPAIALCLATDHVVGALLLGAKMLEIARGDGGDGGDDGDDDGDDHDDGDDGDDDDGDDDDDARGDACWERSRRVVNDDCIATRVLARRRATAPATPEEKGHSRTYTMREQWRNLRSRRRRDLTRPARFHAHRGDGHRIIGE